MAAVLLFFLVGAAVNDTVSGPLRVSLVEVLANPDRFDRKRLFVAGYIHVQGDEDQRLFLHCDDLEAWNAANSIRLVVPDSMRPRVRNGALVFVEGTFSLKHADRWKQWAPGELSKLNRIEPWPFSQDKVCSAPSK